jgi:ankyrin repeat protein
VRVRLVLLFCYGIIEVTTAYSDSCLRSCLLLSNFLGLTCVHQSGMTALMWAVKANCSRSVELLLDGGANTEICDKVYHVM